MAYKQSKHLFQGMSKDLSDDKQKGIYYIDAHNIRITAREDTTLLSVTNEKGNTKLIFTAEDGINYAGGQYIGHAVLNDYLILFNKQSDGDAIWRMNMSTLTSKRLYLGNLNFSENAPIETLADYETDSIQKVYWTDGINQPRFINIVSSYTYSGNGVDPQFDFTPEVYPNDIDTLAVSVEKLIGTEGIFASGTIQYFISYYNKFGQESNIVWQSPLYYISPLNRGGSVSETVANSFKLTISNPTGDFDYVRIYAVQHTSEDTDLIARRVIDLSMNSYIEFIDTGTIGETINAADLYYKGGIPLAIGTMAAKDQTLFLGNIEIKNRETIPSDIVETFRNNIANGLGYIPKDAYPKESPNNLYYDYDNQLNYNSSLITTFKYKEKYRFGLQFQDKWGRWSEPVFLKDLTNENVAPYKRLFSTYLAEARLILDNIDIINRLKGEPYHYVKVRPLVVLPSENERECVAQGVLCPTVYNVQDRLDNSPFAQPSWFFRPYWPITWPYKWKEKTDDEKGSDFGTLLPYAHNGLILGGLSMHGEIEKSYSIQGYYTEGNKIRISKKSNEGSAEHNYFPNYADLFNGYSYNGNKEKDLTKINNPKDFYYIDQSLVTLNSPDIDFGNIQSTEGLAFRVIGALNVTGCYGTMYLETENSPNDFWEAHDSSNGRQLKDTLITAQGFYKKDIAIKNFNIDGCRIFGNGPYWLDVPYYYWGDDEGTLADYGKPAGTASEFIIYPWQSTGSLGGGSFNIPEIAAPLNGELKHKIISNLRYSPETVYLTQPCYYGTSDIQLVDDVSNSATSINVSSDLHYSDIKINYYGSIDKLLTVPEHTDGNHSWKDENYGFDVVVANRTFNTTDSPSNAITAYELLRKQRVYTSGINSALDGNHKTALHKKYTATSITYKSTPHAVIALSPSDDSTINILPSVNNTWGNIPEYRSNSSDPKKSSVTGDHNLINKEEVTGGHRYKCVSKSFWQTDSAPATQYVMQQNIDVTFSNQGGVLLVGEIYRPAELMTNKFGGTTEDAIQQNVWIPAGESVPLYSGGVTINWTEGDTYFQRYDCLKTYPYSNENENNIVEILSFLCETRTNIAGRYDKNRGLRDNTYITNENFNLINTGYTQKDNFFSYRILDERFNISKFKSQLTWTKTKTVGALTDTWTSITLANTLDLDGDKGELVSLNRYKNDIVAFQPKGISQIVYNPNVQINTTSGLPIEIANSGKVQGKRYLYEGVGCSNKWSICDEAYGSLYFMDNLNKSIYKLSDQGLVSLTDVKGLKAWMEDVNTTEGWSPYAHTSNTSSVRETPKGFRTFYDKAYKDVYFVNNTACLVYSDLLDQFVSFMDYQNTDGMMNIGDNFYALYNKDVWQQFAGKYNEIYGQYRDYDITFLDNLQPEMNKIFTNLEFRSDAYDRGTLVNDRTFNRVRVYNEYQDSNWVSLNTLIDRPYLSDIQKKFRVWRVQLPRDKDNPLNRINNTWARITLKRTNPELQSDERIVLHDAVVGYYI